MRRTLVAILYAGASDTDAGGSRRRRAQRRASIRSPCAGPPRATATPGACASTRRPPSGRRDDTPFAHDQSVVVAPRSTLVAVEEAEPADVVRRRRGAAADAELLGRLASAAGIEPAWWDLAGRRHVVGADTQRALLGAMGLSAASSGEARDRLAALADARERRALPTMVVARADVAAQVALAAMTPALRRRRALRLRREDGTDTWLRFAPDDLPANVVTAADGRAVAQRMLALPPLPAGIHTLSADDGSGVECRVLVAPERCYLPVGPARRRAPLRTLGAPVCAAAARRPGHRRFHGARAAG